MSSSSSSSSKNAAPEKTNKNISFTHIAAAKSTIEKKTDRISESAFTCFGLSPDRHVNQSHNDVIYNTSDPDDDEDGDAGGPHEQDAVAGRRSPSLNITSDPLPVIVHHQHQQQQHLAGRRRSRPRSPNLLMAAASCSSTLQHQQSTSLSDLHMHHSNTSRLQFNELLISAVENRPAIWDASHPEHKNARRLAVLWDEIGIELKTAVKIVVERWRNLRDTYRKQLRKINHACQNGDGEIPRVRWMHFEQMSFLIPSLTTIRSSGGSNANSGSVHHNNACMMDDQPSTMDHMELPEHLRELETSDGDVHSVDNIFEMVEPILNNHSPTGSSVGCGGGGGILLPPLSERRSRSSSAASDEMSRAMSMTPPPLQAHHQQQQQQQQQQQTTMRHSPRAKRRRRSETAAAGAAAAAVTNNHLDGQFLQHLYQSTGLIQENARNLQLVNHQLETCLKDKPDPIEAFLYSLAPSLRATPPRLLPSLQMNLIYITSRYSEGTVPKELLQFDNK